MTTSPQEPEIRTLSLENRDHYAPENAGAYPDEAACKQAYVERKAYVARQLFAKQTGGGAGEIEERLGILFDRAATTDKAVVFLGTPEQQGKLEDIFELLQDMVEKTNEYNGSILNFALREVSPETARMLPGHDLKHNPYTSARPKRKPARPF